MSGPRIRQNSPPAPRIRPPEFPRGLSQQLQYSCVLLKCLAIKQSNHPLRHPQFQLLVRIHHQDVDGCPADRCTACDVDAFPAKRIVPRMSSRMIQLTNLTRFGVDSRKIWTLMQVAIDTRQRQIFWIIAAAVLLRNNMLDV